MKVLTINGSPKMDKGNTAMVLNPFLEGMRDAGAEVELFYTKKLKINPCQGELSCWFRTLGECFQNDDTQMLYPKLREADIWVFATPVYFGGVAGSLKNLIDRTHPLVPPWHELRDGHCCHSVPEDHKHRRVVLVASCGFWEIDNFDPLVAEIKTICHHMMWEFAGALLRPHSGPLGAMKEMGNSVDDIFEAAKEAGRELVKDGKMSAETLNTISRPLMPLETFIQVTNQRFQQMLTL